MTARWSGAARTSRRKPKRTSGLEVERWRVFPTALDRQSPKWVFPAGARDVNVGCRNGFEASCRRDRGTLQGGTRARRPAIEKTTAPERDRQGFSAQQGCSGQVTVERPAQAPLKMVSGESVGPSFEPQVESVEGARSPSAVEL